MNNTRKYRYLISLLILWAAAGGFTDCGKKEPVNTGKLDLETGCFSLYTYDDSASAGDSSIALHRETLRGEKGVDETVWTVSGEVTTKYAYGYAGLVLIPDDKTLARLQSGAETIKLRISGDGRRYRLSVDTENVKDGNTFGREITVPERAGEISVPLGSLKQESGWGTAVPFDRALIKNIKIQTIGQPLPSFRFTVHSVEIL